MKRTIRDLKAIKGKVVLLRVDFNVPFDDNGYISDTTRIDNEIPTIEYLSKQGAKIVILSHLGRPKGYEIKNSLWPIALYLMKKIKSNVSFCSTVLGDEAKERIKAMREGSVLVLENIRFYEGENTCDKKFSKELASLGDIYVNDAFGVVHRDCASNYGVARLLPNAIGLLMEREIENLSKLTNDPQKPFVAIIGGTKVESKVKILEKFIEKADVILIGGAMAYTFLKAKGENIGASTYYYESEEYALGIMQKVEMAGKKLLLPIDHVAVKNSDSKKLPIVTKKLTGDMIGYDIGPKTVKLFEKEIRKAKQIFWNGPMGMFEKEPFDQGTNLIAQIISTSKGFSVVGGGDTVSAVNKTGLQKRIGFISTGGGATLKYLENGNLPALEVIQEKTL